MGKLISIIVTVGIFAAVLIFGGAFYIVNESEQVVITQFGKPVGDPITTPGLKIKTPFLETAKADITHPKLKELFTKIIEDK